MRKGLYLLAPFFIALVYVTCIKRTKGFSYKKIHSRYSYDHRWDFGRPDREQERLLDQISSQNFSLLGSGKECYAFVSDDGEIIVKFFKQKHMRTQYSWNYLPLPQTIQLVHDETLLRRKYQRDKLYQSCQIAYERLPKESGVLYLHLTKTGYLNRLISILTPQGKRLTLKLDDMEFLVQKRATPILDFLKEHPQKGKKTIDAILTHLMVRQAMGVGDADINCRKNLGIIDGKVIQIDVGELYPLAASPPRKEELISATLDLKAFLEVHHQDLVPYLEKAIERRGGNAT